MVGTIQCLCDKIIGNDIHLDFPSVGATENIILASIFEAWMVSALISQQ